MSAYRAPRYDPDRAHRQQALRLFIANHHDRSLINKHRVAGSYGLTFEEAQPVFGEFGL